MKLRNLPISLFLISIVLGGFSFGFYSFIDGPAYTPRSVNDQLKNYRGKPATEFLAKIRNNQNTGVIMPQDIKQEQEELESINNSRAINLEWKQMGPDNFGGRTRAIVTREVNDQILVYAAGVSGGIWKSENLGTTWKKVNYDTDNLNVSCMAVADNGTIYAGTGETFDTQDHTGLGEMGFTSGFMGQGIFKSSDGENFDLLPATKPDFNNLESDWAFVNELVAFGNDKLYAATNTGLKYSGDGGSTWATAKDTDGNELNLFAWDVKVGTDGNLVTCVNNRAYVSTSGNPDQFVLVSTGDSVSLPNSNVNRIEFAIAPTDPSVIYASVVDSAKDNVYSIYKSNDKGMNWRVILPGTSSVNIFDEQGTYNNALTVFPNDPDKVLLGGIDMWQGEMFNEDGYYDWKSVSQSLTNPLDPTYVHEDHHIYTFLPGSDNQFFAGTDGGIYLGKIQSGDYSFETGNRNYFTTQFYTIGTSGFKNYMLGGTQDIGTISILPTDQGDNNQTGYQIFPGEGGPCAISLIDPKVVLVSSVDGIFRRSDDGGVNYSVFNQFPGDDITNSSFRTPLVLYENFNNENSGDSVWYFAPATVTPGTVVPVYSHNRGYPFPFVIPDGVTLNKGDSLLVKDIVTSYLFVGAQHNIWMTTNVMQFDEDAVWFKISNAAFGMVGRPYSMAMSSDGNHLFVGTLEGRLYRLSNLATAYNYERADVRSPACIVSTEEIELKVPGTDEKINQVITSISVDPNNPNNVMITLGNYGNDHYVMYTDNAIDQFPVFSSRQGNLPHMPVYSCIIEMTDNKKAFVGTEHGIFATENILAESPTWTNATDEMGSVPVWQLKQQIVDQPTIRITTTVNGQVTYKYYPGTYNYGSIYAATYGRGLWRSDDFYLVGVDEFYDAVSEELELKLYPNPVQTTASIEVDVKDNEQVTFRIFDLNGRLVKTREVMLRSGLNKTEIDMQQLQPGTYIIHAVISGRAYSQKFIVN